MFAVRRTRAARSLLVVLALGVTMPVLAVSGVATAADDVSTGDTVVGEFAQVWPEYEDPDEAAEHGDEGPLSYVHTADGDAVRVDTEDVEDIEVGATVELTVGREVSDTASEDLGYAEAREVVETQVLEAAPAPEPVAPATAPFTNAVTVVMVNPAGGVRDSTRLADVVAEVNGPVANFWEGESNGAIKIGVVASHDWINTTAGCTNPYALWTEVRNKVGFPGTGTGAQHLMLYVSGTPENLAGCSYGLGTVGVGPNSGGYLYARAVKTSLIAHELGHNFGLGHSSALQCDGSVHDYDGGTFYKMCGRTPYWDLYDVMGASWDQLGSLNVAQARKLFGAVGYQWFGQSTAPATVTLNRVSQQAGVRTIMLWSAEGTQYVLEYRPAVGRDAWLATPSDNWPGLQSGVLLRRMTTGDDTSLLLDATPSPYAAWNDDDQVALPVGQAVRVYDDHGTGGAAFVITVQSMDASSAVVQVTPTSPITFAHQAAGGDAGTMGPPTSAETCVDRMFGGRYCQRSYQNGGIFWSLATGARRVTAPVHAAYVAAGGASSNWGLPTTDTACGLVEGGCVQKFQYRVWAMSPGTGTFAIRDAIATHWQAAGAESGTLGYPLNEQSCSAGICEQSFQRGTVVSSPTLGAVSVTGALRDAWVAAGGRGGWLGSPTGAMGCGRVRNGCAQSFQGGALYWSQATGAHGVTGGIRGYWSARGAEVGLGYPTGPMTCSGGGCGQPFEIGEVVWSSATGTYLVRGGIHQAWVAAGRETGWLRAPAGEMVCGLVRSGCAQSFQGGALYWSSTTGAHGVTGGIRGYWAARGAEGGLGYPTGPMTCTAGGCGQAFEIGEVVWSSATGTYLVRGGIHQAWVAAGRESGWLGAPAGEMVCGLVRSGCAQSFQGGALYWSSTTGAHGVTGGIRGYWTLRGAERGLGYPTGPMTCSGGGCRQTFEIGEVVWSSATGTYLVRGGIHQAWVAAGRETGWLGAPSAEMVCGLVRSGCAQSFQGGALYWSSTTGAHGVTGGIRGYWAAQGAERGLGYPTGPMTCTAGGCGQTFEIGQVVWSAGTGTHLVRGGIHQTWVANGAGGGSLGHPLTEMVCGLVRSGCAQHFEGGSVYWSSTTGGFAVSGAIRDHWTAQSAERGPLGYPTSVSRAVPGGGTAQDFQGGAVYTDGVYGTRSVSGGIAVRWRAAGGEGGLMGFPVTQASCGLARGGCTQRFFSGDHIVWSPNTGAIVITNRAATAWAAEGGPGGRLGYPASDCRQINAFGEQCVFERGYVDINYSTGLYSAYVYS